MQPQVLENQVSYPSLWYLDRLGFPNEHFCNYSTCVWYVQMIPFIDDLALTLNIISRSEIIYFDFAKAFDKVSHDLILRKLKTCMASMDL